MANPEHVEILKQGVEVWNRWREDNPDIRPDVEGENLSGEDLSDANLTRVNFSRANLNEANFRRSSIDKANLIRAELIGANLSGANLQHSNLTWANLSVAIIRDVKFSGATLHGTCFGWSVLDGADFSNSRTSYASFISTDLSNTYGLDSVIHLGRSSIGIDTIYKSHSNIPKSFLRGCGVPENFISNMNALTMTPIEFYSCFISYSHQDKSFARRLHDQLQARGIRCWLDEKQMLPGDDIYEQVDRGIRLWDKVLLCCSKDSLSSWWVDNEVDTAFEKEQQLQKERGKPVRAIIPMNLDGYMFDDECIYAKAAQLRKRLAADFTGWETDNAKFEEQFERVVKALQTEEAREEAPESRL